MKICFKCNQEKEISCFGFNKRKKDGRQSNCKACQKIYKQSHYKRNLVKYIEKARDYKRLVRKYIKDYKEKSKCIECGEDHIATLDFHHLEKNEKEFQISEANGLLELKKEIEKCIILCANCHRKLHWKENAGVV